MKKMRWILLLAVCLSLVALPALAAPGDAALFLSQEGDRNSNSTSCVLAGGDTFYLVVSQAVYTWRVGEEEPSLLMEGVPDYTLPSGETSSGWQQCFLREDGLYAVNSDAGVVLKLSSQDGKTVAEEVIPLDFEDFFYVETYDGKDYTYTKQLSNWQDIGGRLFVTMEDWNAGDGAPHLYSFDLKTGEKTAYESEFIKKFTAYRDGKLLCLVHDEQNAYDQENNAYKPLNLSVFDPETDTLTPVAQIPGVNPYDLKGLSYDAATDTLYFICPEKIYRMTSLGAPELCAYVPVSYYREYEGSAMARVGDCVMVNGEMGVFVRTADPQYLPKDTLTIYGGHASDAHNKAIAQMDGMPVTFYDKTYFGSAQELGQALVSGENQIDLLSITMSYMDFERLMEKGYCYDLSGSEKLKAYADSLYPFLLEGVTKDGQLLAVPVEMYLNTFGYTRFLSETGLIAPKTFLEACDFLQAWGEEDYFDTFSDYTPFCDTEIKTQMAYMAFDMYADYIAATGQTLTLDSPILRQALSAVQALDLSDWEMQIDYETATDDDWNELYEKNELLSRYAQLSVQYEGEDAWAIAAPISLTEDTPVAISAEVTVLFVNPRSQHLDAAIRYLENYVEALEPITLTNMCPGRNEPVENPYYAMNMEHYDKEIQMAENALKEAKEADKPALEEQLTGLREWRGEYEKNNRYNATAESIAAYRALDSYFFLKRPSPFYSSGNEEFATLYQRYLNGQIPLEQFINEGDAKLRLMLLENQ